MATDSYVPLLCEIESWFLSLGQLLLLPQKPSQSGSPLPQLLPSTQWPWCFANTDISPSSQILIYETAIAPLYLPLLKQGPGWHRPTRSSSPVGGSCQRNRLLLSGAKSAGIGLNCSGLAFLHSLSFRLANGIFLFCDFLLEAQSLQGFRLCRCVIAGMCVIVISNLHTLWWSLVCR